MNKQQATARVQQHIDDTIAAISPGPRLEHESFLTQDCSDPSDNGPQGRIVVSRGYWLRDVPLARNSEIFTAVKRYWTSNGWGILTDDSSSEAPYLWVENREDGFRMSLEGSVDGHLSIGAVSPCIWPDGTPEPQQR